MDKEIKESEEFKIFNMLRELDAVYGKQVCTNTKCPKFQKEMELRFRTRGKKSSDKHLSWRCNGYKCGTYKSIWDGSFFSLFRKKINIIIGLIKCWAAQLTIVKTCSIIKMNFDDNVSENMVAGLFEKLRQICTLSLDKKNIVLGGFGKIVEIDESLYAKVKHWKGKDLRRGQVWVFGLVERKTDNQLPKCYLQVVKDREALTLLSIIYEKCNRGTTVYSDCWSSYNKISNFKDFKHQTVNHSLNFVDPNTGTCTNKIESLWNACKHKFKEMHGCKRSKIQSYIDEFVWRYNNNCDRKECFNLILKEIARFYSPGQR